MVRLLRVLRADLVARLSIRQVGFVLLVIQVMAGQVATALHELRSIDIPAEDFAQTAARIQPAPIGRKDQARDPLCEILQLLAKRLEVDGIP